MTVTPVSSKIVYPPSGISSKSENERGNEEDSQLVGAGSVPPNTIARRSAESREISLLKRIQSASPTLFSHNNIQEVENTICHLQSVIKVLYEQEYDDMRENIIRTANKRLREAVLDNCEPFISPLYPRDALGQIENARGVDKDFMKALLNSAKVECCEFPSYKQYTAKTIPVPGPDGESSEFQFVITFTFGFKMNDIREAVTSGCKVVGVPPGICYIMSDYVGDSFFEIKLTVYFDKSKDEWNEQDGEAWIFHREENSNKSDKLEDVVNFSPEERIYYVDNWPLKGLIVDSLENVDDTDELVLFERKLVTWTSCQIVWIVLSQLLDGKKTKCVRVRNMTRKLIFVLKGWFTGLLLGESFDPPESLRFEL